MADNSTEFKATANQLKVLGVYQRANYRISVVAACKEAGLSRESYYEWHQHVAGFSDWWQVTAEQHFARRLPGVYGAMDDAAQGKDIEKLVDSRAAKLLLDRFDTSFTPATKQEHNVSGSIELDWANMTPEQIDAEVKAVADRSSEPDTAGPTAATHS